MENINTEKNSQINSKDKQQSRDTKYGNDKFVNINGMLTDIKEVTEGVLKNHNTNTDIELQPNEHKVVSTWTTILSLMVGQHIKNHIATETNMFWSLKQSLGYVFKNILWFMCKLQIKSMLNKENSYESIVKVLTAIPYECEAVYKQYLDDKTGYIEMEDSYLASKIATQALSQIKIMEQYIKKYASESNEDIGTDIDIETAISNAKDTITQWAKNKTQQTFTYEDTDFYENDQVDVPDFESHRGVVNSESEFTHTKNNIDVNKETPIYYDRTYDDDASTYDDDASTYKETPIYYYDRTYDDDASTYDDDASTYDDDDSTGYYAWSGIMDNDWEGLAKGEEEIFDRRQNAGGVCDDEEFDEEDMDIEYRLSGSNVDVDQQPNNEVLKQTTKKKSIDANNNLDVDITAIDNFENQTEGIITHIKTNIYDIFNTVPLIHTQNDDDDLNQGFEWFDEYKKETNRIAAIEELASDLKAELLGDDSLEMATPDTLSKCKTLDSTCADMIKDWEKKYPQIIINLNSNQTEPIINNIKKLQDLTRKLQNAITPTYT